MTGLWGWRELGSGPQFVFQVRVLARPRAAGTLFGRGGARGADLRPRLFSPVRDLGNSQNKDQQRAQR
jgi:hypothetical protein